MTYLWELKSLRKKCRGGQEMVERTRDGGEDKAGLRTFRQFKSNVHVNSAKNGWNARSPSVPAISGPSQRLLVSPIYSDNSATRRTCEFYKVFFVFFLFVYYYWCIALRLISSRWIWVYSKLTHLLNLTTRRRQGHVRVSGMFLGSSVLLDINMLYLSHSRCIEHRWHPLDLDVKRVPWMVE